MISVTYLQWRGSRGTGPSQTLSSDSYFSIKNTILFGYNLPPPEKYLVGDIDMNIYIKEKFKQIITNLKLNLLYKIKCS